ncbi:MAG: hypothetical protein HYT09_00680 [Candidatus Levybacteria bacterium]|nr:hypothetical protein [Candidatus Levybacteria bacterium]
MDEQKDSQVSSPSSEPAIPSAVATSESEADDPTRQLLKAAIEKLYDPGTAGYERPAWYPKPSAYGTIKQRVAFIDGPDEHSHIAVSSYDSRGSSQDLDLPGQTTRIAISFWDEPTDFSVSVRFFNTGESDMAAINRIFATLRGETPKKRTRPYGFTAEVNDGNIDDPIMRDLLHFNWQTPEYSGFHFILPQPRRPIRDEDIARIIGQLQSGTVNAERTKTFADFAASGKPGPKMRMPKAK